MPIHDWTRVTAGTWHAFHLSWIAEIRRAQRRPAAAKLLRPGRADRGTAGAGCPHLADSRVSAGAWSRGAVQRRPEATAGLAVATVPPRARLVDEVEMSEYVLKRRTLVIRHVSGDRIVALLELVSPGNKAARFALCSFVDKAVEALLRGYHLLIVDLFPPTPRDPQGIHGAIWAEFSTPPFTLPPDEPLTLAAYSAGPIKRAYVEPTAVGRELIEMPLFLEPEIYINVPLEETYAAAYRGVPQRWKRVLEDTRPL